ncbi:MAG: ferrochelatase [Gammaproteobacteria bacterium]|nr:ferrochelatase [Gammaproteobacteria bacterium]
MSEAKTSIPSDHPDVRPGKVGVLLVNLGTPSSLSVTDIRRYLKEFLSDRRVIDYSPWLWQPILRGIILNTRPRKTREAYRKIWRRETDESPLRFYTRQQAHFLAERLDNDALVVDWAMNYGEPSIKSRLEFLVGSGCHRIVVLPLYPQYSASTTASVCDRVFDAMKTMNWQPAIRTLDTWHDDPAYIDASVAHLRGQIDALTFDPEVLLMSFHGLPERYLREGDPYHCFCQKTGRLLGEGVARDGLRTMTTFQSRFGPEKWLTPYTDETVEALAKEGVKRLAVFSPGFVSDCVETLEELGIQLRETFLEAGGEEFTVVPCLNDSKEAIDLLETLARRELAGWLKN